MIVWRPLRLSRARQVHVHTSSTAAPHNSSHASSRRSTHVRGRHRASAVSSRTRPPTVHTRDGRRRPLACAALALSAPACGRGDRPPLSPARAWPAAADMATGIPRAAAIARLHEHICPPRAYRAVAGRVKRMSCANRSVKSSSKKMDALKQPQNEGSGASSGPHCTL
jgi:hypothetical protein